MLSDQTSGCTVCKHINIRTNGPTKEDKKGIKEREKKGNRKKRNRKFM